MIFMEQCNPGVNRMEPHGYQVLQIGDLGIDELQFIETQGFVN